MAVARHFHSFWRRYGHDDETNFKEIGFYTHGAAGRDRHDCNFSGFFAAGLVKGKIKAKQVSCLSNLNQLSIAAKIYADDNQGNLVSSWPLGNFVPDLAVMSDTKCVYGFKSELILIDIKPLGKTSSGQYTTNATVQQISDFRKMAFNGVVWIRYNPAASNFLFCARPTGSDWRYLYQFTQPAGN